MITTKKDEQIYNHIKKIGFATVKQIGKLFFGNMKYSSSYAKKRLNHLLDYRYIYETRSVNCNQNIFYVDPKFKRQTYHNIVVMDIYSQFYKMNNLDIINFTKPKCFANKKIMSDAFITVKYNSCNNVMIQNFIFEVETSKNDYRNTIGKYNDPIVQADIKTVCGGYNPVLVFVDNIKHDMSKISCPYPLIQIDSNLTNLPLIFSTK